MQEKKLYTTHRLTMRGRSKIGTKSYALPLNRDELKLFGIDIEHARDYNLQTIVTKDLIVIKKA